MKTLDYDGDSYEISLTRPKRRCDLARFEVRKDGRHTYIVTFQAHDGSKGQCDCKAGKHRKLCRHQKMLKPMLVKAVAAATQTAPQTSLDLSHPAVKEAYDACRTEYAKILQERKALNTKLKALETKGRTLRSKLVKAAA